MAPTIYEILFWAIPTIALMIAIPVATRKAEYEEARRALGWE